MERLFQLINNPLAAFIALCLLLTLGYVSLTYPPLPKDAYTIMDIYNIGIGEPLQPITIFENNE